MDIVQFFIAPPHWNELHHHQDYQHDGLNFLGKLFSSWWSRWSEYWLTWEAPWCLRPSLGDSLAGWTWRRLQTTDWVCILYKDVFVFLSLNVSLRDFTGKQVGNPTKAESCQCVFLGMSALSCFAEVGYFCLPHVCREIKAVSTDMILFRSIKQQRYNSKLTTYSFSRSKTTTTYMTIIKKLFCVSFSNKKFSCMEKRS